MSDYKPVGMFISQNENGQYIYSDPFIKGGFQLGKKDFEKYRIYASRFTISLIVVALLLTFVDPLPSIIVGLFTAVVGELLFRFKFLKSLIYLPDYKSTDQRTFLQKITNSSDDNKKLIKALLLVVLAVLIVINAYQQNFRPTIIYACWVVAFLAFIYAILFVVSYFKYRGKN